MNNLEKAKRNCREYSASHRKERAAYWRQWKKDNPDKLAAYLKKSKFKNKVRRALNYAIECGVIERKPCEKCGNPKSQGHHPDYSKPLEVLWLCPKHHSEVHYP